MISKNENYDGIIAYESNAIDTSNLQKDLEDLFAIIIDQSIFLSGEVLLFIDATNGHIALTPYDHSNLETVNGASVWLLLHDLWEDGNNAYDFDDMTSEAIALAVGSGVGQKLKKGRTLFLQTETDDKPVEI